MGMSVSVLMLEDEITEVAICCSPLEALETALSVVVTTKISLARVLRCVANEEGVGTRVVATKGEK